MKVSRVSPERCEMNWVYPASRHTAMASSVSLTVPIWFSFMSAELPTLRVMASRMMDGLVTKISSPTNWTRSPSRAVNFSQPSQSFSPRPSSMDQIG